MVGTSEDDHITTWQPLGIVTRLIDPNTMILHETFTGHLIEVVIATCHTSAADIELTDNASWQFVAIGIDDKLLDVQLWLTNSHHLGIRQFRIVRGDSNLRRTIAIEDTGLGDATHLLQERITEFLTTGTTDLHLRDGLAEIVAREPGLPAGWCT